MGLGSDLISELRELRYAKLLKKGARVVEIGAQQLSNDFLRGAEALEDVFDIFGRTSVPNLGPPIDAGEIAGLEQQSDQASASQAFWEALGFEYRSIDFGGHRHAYALDLNKDSVPEEWRNRFDLVVNAGTTEHVANQDNAFRVIHDLAAPGGLMLHDVPAAGMPIHGLVTYSMKFFWHLCRENQYKVIRLEMNSGGAAPLPSSIIEMSDQLGRGRSAMEFGDEPIRDWTVRATLQKPGNAPYVTPLDLPSDVMPKAKPLALQPRSLRMLSRLLRRA
jgi:SAM-dependent methyltransferase